MERRFPHLDASSSLQAFIFQINVPVQSVSYRTREIGACRNTEYVSFRDFLGARIEGLPLDWGFGLVLLSEK
jgi:hypothetical protein